MAGFRVVAIDGVEPWEPPRDHCATCLTRTHSDGAVGFYHRVVVASLVGRMPIVLAWTPEQPGEGSTRTEGERTAAHQLLPELHRRYHHQIEVLVCDALYCNSPWITAVRAVGWDMVIRRKDDRLTIVQDAVGRLRHAAVTAVQKTRRETLTIWDLGDFAWNDCAGLRVIWWQRRDHRTDQIHEGAALTTCAPTVSADRIVTMMRHRWDEENSIFRTGQTT